MNGLKFIRNRCNISLSSLADELGVTRQAVSMWEQDKKAIPIKRLNQLKDYFGLDIKYFCEIGEKEKQELLDKAMFRYVANGNETYRYKRSEDIASLDGDIVCFLDPSDQRLDDQLAATLKKKKETLEKVSDMIDWSNNAGSIASQIMCMNRGCSVFNMQVSLFEHMKAQKVAFRMPFFHEFTGVMKATLLAYGLIDEKDAEDTIIPFAGVRGSNTEWVLSLSKQIKEHWDKTYACFEEHELSVRDILREPQPKKTIAEIEQDVKKFKESGMDVFVHGSTTFVRK